jgi:glycosyltransferase involved in cell wall biosynthesis
MKGNILFVNSISILGGGEIWMVTAMEELQRRGYNVSLICRRNAEIAEFAENKGIAVDRIRIGGDFDPLTIFSLIRIIIQKKIDYIIVNTGKELRLCGIAAHLSSRPKIIARQGIDYPLKNKLRYRLSYNYLADQIVANSEATKKTMLKNAPWLKHERIKVIYNGINPELYSGEKIKDLRKYSGIPSGEFIIGFAGRLSIQKGIIYLLEGFRELQKKINNVHLIIAGTGELHQMIEEFTRKFSLDKNIHLQGFRKDMPDFMRTIDLFVLPSLWEGFGIVLIEAMAAGKPCITTNISSMPEIVTDGKTGLIVPPEDSHNLAEAMIRLITNPGLAAEFGNEGLNVVKKKFTLEKMINNYEELLN